MKRPCGDYFPRIETVTDSLGNTTVGTTSIREGSLSVATNTTLRPGNTVTYRCRGTDPQGRKLSWELTPPSRTGESACADGDEVELTWTVTDEDIAQQALLCIYLTAEAPYHRLGGSTKFDFAASFAYAVLPVLAGPAIAGSEID